MRNYPIQPLVAAFSGLNYIPKRANFRSPARPGGRTQLNLRRTCFVTPASTRCTGPQPEHPVVMRMTWGQPPNQILSCTLAGPYLSPALSLLCVAIDWLTVCQGTTHLLRRNPNHPPGFADGHHEQMAEAFAFATVIFVFRLAKDMHL